MRVRVRVRVTVTVTVRVGLGLGLPNPKTSAPHTDPEARPTFKEVLRRLDAGATPGPSTGPAGSAAARRR